MSVISKICSWQSYQCWKILLIYFSLEADIRTAKISRLSTQLRRQLHQLRRTLRTHHYHHKDLVASGSVLVKAVSRNSSACVDSLFENSKKSRKTRWDLYCHLAIFFCGQKGCVLAVAGGPLAPNCCSWATRKSYVFQRTHTLGTLDFTGSEHWVYSAFLRAQPLQCLYNGTLSLSLSHLFVAKVSSKFHFVKFLKTNSRMWRLCCQRYFIWMVKPWDSSTDSNVRTTIQNSIIHNWAMSQVLTGEELKVMWWWHNVFFFFSSMEVGIENKQQTHLAYVILWQQNSDIFFPFLSTDPDQQDASQKLVLFHNMMSSAVKKLFHIPSSARIVSFYKN